MIPRKKSYAQVKVDEWLNGEISDIQYEMDHEFNYKGNKKKGDAVKIFIFLPEYSESKSTGWWAFNYSDKSNLYNLFLKPLVENAVPNMAFDLDLLKGMKVRVMYSQEGEYQNLKMVRPSGQKLFAKLVLQKESIDLAETIENIDPEEVPF